MAYHYGIDKIIIIRITDIIKTQITKRLNLTVEEVLDNVLSDDENFDDPDEPIMDGSDDKFSDSVMTTMIQVNKIPPVMVQTPPSTAKVRTLPSLTPLHSCPQPWIRFSTHYSLS